MSPDQESNSKFIFTLSVTPKKMKARNKARQEINRTTLGAGAMAIAPLPGTSLALTAAEASMIKKIAEIYGLRIEGLMWSILLKTILLKLGGASLLKKIAMEGSLLLGPFGGFVRPTLALSVVKGIGEAATSFFEAKFPGLDAYEKPALEEFLEAFCVADIDEETLRRYWQGLG